MQVALDESICQKHNVSESYITVVLKSWAMSSRKKKSC